MGLDLLPRLCLCADHCTQAHGVEAGRTHLLNESCPFADDGFPIGAGNCCRYRGKALAYGLAALGEDDFASKTYDDMDAEEAAEFAEELREVADRLETAHKNQSFEAIDVAEDGKGTSKQDVYQVYGTTVTFEEAVAEIRRGARWYEKVAALGFGVYAWA